MAGWRRSAGGAGVAWAVGVLGAVGAVGAVGARWSLLQALRWKFRRDVQRLNRGDYSSLLAAYGRDAVLHFNAGDHRWSGEWRGRAEIERFLQNFTAAEIRGEIVDLAVSGPLWRMTLWVRFDDHADAPDGERVYENQTALVVHTRWGRIVEQHDFYADTGRILALEAHLRARGVAPVSRVG